MEQKALIRYTLAELRELLEGQNELLVNNYLSQHLAIASNLAPVVRTWDFIRRPFLLEEMRILIVKEGWTEPTVNLTDYHLERGDLLFLGPNGIAQIRNLSDNVQGLAISMSDELFRLALGNRVPKAFDGHLRDFRLHLDEEQLQTLQDIHTLLFDYTRHGGHSPQTTLHLIAAFLWHVDALWGKAEQTNSGTLSYEQQLLANFIQLVNAHARTQHGIGFYAERLFLSPRYLSTLIKKASGRTAKQWIDDALLMNIKVELKHSDKQTAQISEEMNFPNPAFFCKYFKRLTGITPQQYRRS